ncbi:hypothetical protein N7532_001215 [Penicillium argentinense]|uniref:Uncharacterized protein n=1 Tax=Penicillium argentinense TaxID=1131581 RepID=A0A9W9G234_9EURO|nr:uncharacterized protein N7532_001215 [Penicillium argentinense]KAJ5110680.1 hypothetical protein N7532_001215 [Penicillium argentinense]
MDVAIVVPAAPPVRAVSARPRKSARRSRAKIDQIKKKRGKPVRHPVTPVKKKPAAPAPFVRPLMVLN